MAYRGTACSSGSEQVDLTVWILELTFGYLIKIIRDRDRDRDGCNPTGPGARTEAYFKFVSAL
jgi:hypothetical protein